MKRRRNSRGTPPALRELPRSREAAKEQGLCHYRGKRCRKCRSERRYTSSGGCVACAVARAKKHAPRQAAQVRAANAKERALLRQTCKNQTCTREFTPKKRKDQLYCSKACALRQAKRDWKARNAEHVRRAENKRKRRKYKDDPEYREKSKGRSSAYWHSLDEDTKFSRKKEQRGRSDPEARRLYFREYHQNRSESDPEFRLAAALRSRVRAAIRNNAGEKALKTMLLIGCSLKELRVYLESKFEPWMTWENYGEWHVDHIRPLISFDLTDPSQQQQACHYTNLQPLSARANLRKSSRF